MEVSHGSWLNLCAHCVGLLYVVAWLREVRAHGRSSMARVGFSKQTRSSRRRNIEVTMLVCVVGVSRGADGVSRSSVLLHFALTIPQLINNLSHRGM